jgi:hypothetical protein
MKQRGKEMKEHSEAVNKLGNLILDGIEKWNNECVLSEPEKADMLTFLLKRTLVSLIIDQWSLETVEEEWELCKHDMDKTFEKFVAAKKGQ